MSFSVEEITKRKTIFLVFDVLFLILPLICGFFIFQNKIFLQLDWIKLSLLSASIITPFVFLNLLPILLLIARDNSKENPKDDSPKGVMENPNDVFISLTLSIILTGFITYLALFVSFISINSLKFSIYVVSAIEIIIFVLLVFVVYNVFKSDTNKKNG